MRTLIERLSTCTILISLLIMSWVSLHTKTIRSGYDHQQRNQTEITSVLFWTGQDGRQKRTHSLSLPGPSINTPVHDQAQVYSLRRCWIRHHSCRTLDCALKVRITDREWRIMGNVLIFEIDHFLSVIDRHWPSGFTASHQKNQNFGLQIHQSP